MRLTHTHQLAGRASRHGGPAPHTHTQACGSRKSTRRAVRGPRPWPRVLYMGRCTCLTHGSMYMSYVDPAVEGRGPIMVTWVDVHVLCVGVSQYILGGWAENAGLLSILSPCSLCILYLWVCVLCSCMGRSLRSCTMQYIDTVGPAVHMRRTVSVK